MNSALEPRARGLSVTVAPSPIPQQGEAFMKRVFLLALSLVVAFSTTALAATFAAGTYQGKTSQNLGVTIKVKTSGRCSSRQKAPCVVFTRYRANYNCYGDDGSKGTASNQRTNLGVAPIRNGQVNATFATASPSDHIRLRVKFAGKSATGAFREFYVKESGETTTLCTTRRVTFSAKRA